MVERFLFYCTTENQGLHNRKSGFAQPKIRVCTTENQGLHNRKSGFFKYVKYLIFGLHNRKSGFLYR